MLFRQLFDATSCTYTYLIASGYGREALLIDPVLEQMPLYVRLFDELRLKLVLSIETHTHADHITAAASLQEKFQSQIGMGEISRAEHVNLKIKDNEKITIDGIQLKALHTPGHTQDSYSYLMDDRVFTGDTLLIRGTGRTDFQGGDPYQQYDSLFHKLLKLPDTLQVYPAHDYKGMAVSTIGEEKRYNPRLQVSGAEEYATLMNHLDLPKPGLMDVAVPANLQCGRQLCKKLL
ncbi:MBL fold metallo-hydrolase [Coxiella burnetii]|uniref:MBL fold metallo-hydrolase n=1 Tax=Coxiella burnetii TaxID=777 RepID=UPI0000ECFF3F|nr:MBL fold metallo-hydrolase [Coxiella burnetii]ACJ20010.1 Zn-dependent hydrolase, glyoxalase II family [Coxiella burnetii CbuK_Q154]ATN85459.1 Zn-dependent hydrolase [Coxiella burnetii str. Schperling]EAX33793.1 Zn-dependent hydrolase [Coxiella burnetii 'MSU Goat Q177']EDR36399.1 metallo-beta-lactamase family protein [Coxiella burnetii Q321]PHH58347.1 Zn-dependent hydrolase [Coxiella burnetii]